MRSLAAWGLGFGMLLVHVGIVATSLAGPAVLLWGTISGPEGVTAAVWRHAASDGARWVGLLANTATVLVACLAVAIPAGLALGALLFRTDLPGRAVWIALLVFLAPFPLHVPAAGAVALFGAESLRGSAVAVGWIHAVARLPLVAVLLGLALRSVPRSIEESALADGMSPFRAFLHVTLRSAAPAVAAVSVLLAVLVATDYSVSDVLVVRTFAEEVYTQFALYGRPEEPAVVALPQWLALALLLWALRATILAGRGLSGGHDEPRQLPLAARQTARSRLARRLLGLAVGIVMGGLVAAFIAFVAERPGSLERLPEYARIFSPEIRTSLLWATVAAAAATLLGPGLAWTLVRTRVAGALVALWAVTSLACPAPILGVGLIRLFNRPGLLGAVYDSPAILGIAYLVRFLPVSVLLVAPAIRAIPRELELAARVDGCGSLGVGRHVVLPLCRRAMALSFLVVLALSLAELPCSHLVTPPGHGTVPGRFFSLIHYGLDEDAAALCVLSSLAVALPSVGILLFSSRALGLAAPRPRPPTQVRFRGEA